MAEPLSLRGWPLLALLRQHEMEWGRMGAGPYAIGWACQSHPWASRTSDQCGGTELVLFRRRPDRRRDPRCHPLDSRPGHALSRHSGPAAGDRSRACRCFRGERRRLPLALLPGRARECTGHRGGPGSLCAITIQLGPRVPTLTVLAVAVLLGACSEPNGRPAASASP